MNFFEMRMEETNLIIFLNVFSAYFLRKVDPNEGGRISELVIIRLFVFTLNPSVVQSGFGQLTYPAQPYQKADWGGCLKEPSHLQLPVLGPHLDRQDTPLTA